MFSLGFIIPVIELELMKHGLTELHVGLVFSTYTFMYAGISLFGVSTMKSFEPSKTMFFGIVLSIAAFFTLGLLSEWLVLTIVALAMMGISGSVMYSKLYLVPTVPHMITVAQTEYEYENNEELIDALCGITNFACNIGEILGPIASGLMVDSIGFGGSMSSIGGVYIIFGIVFIKISGLFSSKSKLQLPMRASDENNQELKLSLLEHDYCPSKIPEDMNLLISLSDTNTFSAENYPIKQEI